MGGGGGGGKGGGSLGVGGIPPPLQIVVQKVRAFKLVQNCFTGTLNYIIDDSRKNSLAGPCRPVQSSNNCRNCDFC
jgi:hypothetical protein